MAWTVVLESEDKIVVRTVSSEFVLHPTKELSQFSLLKYLDPYGDAVFNRLQMNDLIRDIHELGKTQKDKLLEEILALAENCKEEPHTYLWFYGD